MSIKKMSTKKMSIKTLLACLLGTSLLSAFANAQGMSSADPGPGAAPGMTGAASGGGKHRGAGKQAQEQKTAPRADEKAYRAAIESVPAQKFDPWRNVR